jgi:threonine synthase
MKLRSSAYRVVWRLAGATPLPMCTSQCRPCVLGEAAAAAEEVRRNTRRLPASSSALPRLRIDSPVCRSRVAIAARGPLDPGGSAPRATTGGCDEVPLASALRARGTPEAEALEVIWRHVGRIVEVSDEEVAHAIAILFQYTHNCAEGAGAAPFAAIRKERARLVGRKVAAVLSGGNIDRDLFAAALARHESR